MEEEKTLINEVASDAYDASEKPFDFLAAGGLTALLCEPDPAQRQKITESLKNLSYHVTEAASARDALKKMRFHIYNVVVLNETFDTQNPDANDVLVYLQSLGMSTRRQIFLALVSDRFRTMDNMVAFNKSVNIIVNTKNLDDAETILKSGVAENDSFYRIYRETMQKIGKA